MDKIVSLTTDDGRTFERTDGGWVVKGEGYGYSFEDFVSDRAMALNFREMAKWLDPRPEGG